MTHDCPQCGGHVVFATGRWWGYGRCRRCAVVLRVVSVPFGWDGWRLLTDAEWDAADPELASIRPWVEWVAA